MSTGPKTLADVAAMALRIERLERELVEAKARSKERSKLFHDLLGYVNVVSMAAEVLGASSLDERSRGVVDRIRRAVPKMVEAIRQIREGGDG